MANNIVSLDTFDLLFADFIQSSLNLNDDQVLISYQEKGQKSSKISEDVVYVKVLNEQDEVGIYKNRSSSYDPETEQVTISQTAMRMLLLQVVFYGPNSEVLATTLNEIMYTDNAKQFLYNNNLSLVPIKTSPPMKSYEKINERWWHREDLKLYFYNSVTIEETVSTVQEANISINYD